MSCTQADLQDPDSPYSGIAYGSKTFPTFKPLGNGVCNVDLPNDSTLNRYLFVIQYYVSQARTSPGASYASLLLIIYACT